MLVALQILNKVLQTKDFGIIKRNALDNTFFTGFIEEFNFIENHLNLYDNIPDLTTFLAKFPNFEIFEVNESEQYLIDCIYEEYGYQKFANLIPKLGQMAEADSREAYNFLVEEMPKLKPPALCKGIDIISTAQERYEKYINRSKEEDAATIKTGLVELDDIFGGWEYGDELVTIVARTNQGKSWILMKFLAEAWKQGRVVSLYSGEMNHLKLGYRFDALFGHFSNRCLTRGAQLDQYDKYIQDLITIPTKFNIATQKEFGGRPTVRKLRNFIESTHPDIVGIDQYSLMDDARSSFRDPPRLKLAHIAEDLFALSSEYKIPILGLAQANREGVKKDTEQDAPGLENIKESDDIAHNSSKALGIRQSSFGLVLDIIKNREGRVGDKLLYSWDIDSGHFTYIPSALDASKPEIRQQAQIQNKQQYTNSVNPF